MASMNLADAPMSGTRGPPDAASRSFDSKYGDHVRDPASPRPSHEQTAVVATRNEKKLATFDRRLQELQRKVSLILASAERRDRSY